MAIAGMKNNKSLTFELDSQIRGRSPKIERIAVGFPCTAIPKATPENKSIILDGLRKIWVRSASVPSPTKPATMMSG
ncbi:hypothetical protein GCM10007053_18490 [Halioglobus pacificus]|uniref:Uncharacterized protein n=1 Tax=Parahalioglobus pacificus TaxID=930806 RepID=A0A918XJI9_9GAMM|nr:hypothetical protein GCM10007053_18490 [Halioglobus pacificus]